MDFKNIFVGTKSDLRILNSEKFVTTLEGKKMKSKIGACSLIECSAKKKEHLGDVFEEAIKAVERKTTKRKPVCCIL